MPTSIEPPLNSLPNDGTALHKCMWVFPVLQGPENRKAHKWKCKGCGSESFGSRKRVRYHVLKRPGEGWKACIFNWTQETLDDVDAEETNSKKRVQPPLSIELEAVAITTANKKKKFMNDIDPAPEIIVDDQLLLPKEASNADRKQQLDKISCYYLNKRAAAYNSGMSDSSTLIKSLDEKILKYQIEIDQIVNEECEI